MSRFCFPLIVALVASCVAPACSSANAQEIALKWKFQPGLTVGVEVAQVMNMSMNIAGNPIDVKSKTDQSLTWRVTSVDADGIATVESTIDRIRMESTQPNVGLIQYDSAATDEPTGPAAEIARGIKPLIGVSFTQKMKPTGQIFEVVIPQAALAAMQQGAMGQMGMSGDFIKDLSEKASPEFPANPLKKGDSWSNTAETKSPAGDMKIVNTYTYTGLQPGTTNVHRIAVDMKMEISGAGPQGASIRVVKQNNKGMLLFDNSEGRLLKSELDQNMTLQIDVAGQSIQQQLTQLLKVDFQRK